MALSTKLQFVFPALLHDSGTRVSLIASAYIITILTGSGVLSLARVNAQLGLIAGSAAIFFFSTVKYLGTSVLLSTCYRSDARNSQRRYHTYVGALQENLGGTEVKICVVGQYLKLFGSAIGYTIGASASMMAIQRSICFHSSEGRNPCQINSYPYIIAFGLVQIILSVIGDFKWFSIIAAVMSFIYSTIGLGLGIAKVAETGKFWGSVTRISNSHVNETQKIWRSFQALGDIAFTFSFSIDFNEIQNTVFNSPPSDSKIIMKKAIKFSFAFITFFYMVCGYLGYAAFGESTPRNLLAGFGFYNPYWLLDIAHVAVSLGCVAEYQVNSRALFALTEDAATHERFTGEAINPILSGRPDRLNLYRSVCRTIFGMIITVISMFLKHSLENVARLTGILGFWPLTVYLPVRMYIAKKKITRWSAKWVFLQILSLALLIINIAAVVGYIAWVVLDLQTHKLFKEN
ncbi:amino acid permease 3-like [Carya illinoinensis]|uniref:amino acid permease 3-like n=1 Tax=Carya illinoinensis TaxID=32201 RepID=UPI001C7185A9|nr:amino acid permease 3-like [Carya illinoinensis]